MTVKVAFIGAGSIAQSHLDAVRLAGGDVVGVCTRSEGGLRFAQANKIPHYAPTPRQLIDICQPDAVFLLTQPNAYYDILADIQCYNLPLFIEKPLGNRGMDADRLRSVLPDTVFVGLNRRFYGNILHITEMIDDEPPFKAQVIMPEREKDYGQYPDRHIRNHWDMLQGIHLVDLITHLAGGCETVLSGVQWGDLPLTITPQYTMTLYRTNRQHHVSFLSNFDSPGGWRIHLFLSKREIIISPLEKTVIRSLSGIEELPTDERDQQAKPGFLAQTECFFEGVQGKRPPNWVSFNDAREAMRTLEALFHLEAPVAV